MSNKKLIPDLRFPEFKIEGEWLEKKLGKVAEIITGSTPRTNEPSFYGGDKMFVSPSDISDKRIVSQTKTTLTELGFSKTRQIKAGSVLFVCIGSTIGKVAQNKFDCSTNQQINSLITFKGYSSEYLYSLLDANSSEIASIAGNHAVPIINKSSFSEIKLPFPKSPLEQQKIASCLSSLDEVIAANSQKLELLKDHKKGLMQNLFPQEGESVPKLRFVNDDSWTEVNLPEMVNFQEGPGIMAVDFRNEGVPLVRMSGIGGSTVTLKGCNFLDPDMVKNKWAHFRLSPNDLVISTSATFGLTSIVNEVAAGAVFYTGLIRFTPINEKLCLDYLKTFLGSPLFGRQAKLAAVGGGIKHFGPTHLKQMKMALPSLEEQQKIASCLSSLDGLITAQAEKIEQLKLHKKGLMQGLFPKIND